MTVTLLPSQLSTFTTESPIPYTGNPFLLCWSDALLFLKCSWALIGILYPWTQWHNKELDELYPSPQNLVCLALHGFLIALQLVFLLSLPFLVIFPVWIAIAYVGTVMAVTIGVCWILNGSEDFVESTFELGSDRERFREECWVYLNGVAVGKHWLQGNVERLAMTFRRPVVGVHNKTYGIVFDLLQCIIERNFCYATNDVRVAYALIKGRLLEERFKKVVLILHSQGGIQGALILDWLLSELPHDIIQKLEIYTFASAGNHFNNPNRTTADMEAANNPSVISYNDKAVRHIEHYAHDGDFVARWGVLTFTRMRNRYMGRVFIRSGMGHLLNQHYLNAMFPLGEDQRVLDESSFMDSEVNFTSDGAEDKARESVLETLWNGGNGANGAIVEDMHSPLEPVSLRRTESVLAAKLGQRKPKVRDFSRLWQYRNGGSPGK